MFDKCEVDVPQTLEDIMLDEKVEQDAIASLEALARQEIDELEVIDMQDLGYEEMTHGD